MLTNKNDNTTVFLQCKYGLEVFPFNTWNRFNYQDCEAMKMPLVLFQSVSPCSFPLLSSGLLHQDPGDVNKLIKLFILAVVSKAARVEGCWAVRCDYFFTKGVMSFHLLSQWVGNSSKSGNLFFFQRIILSLHLGCYYKDPLCFSQSLISWRWQPKRPVFCHNFCLDFPPGKLISYKSVEILHVFFS